MNAKTCLKQFTQGSLIFFLIITCLLSQAVFAQEQDITPLKEARKEARNLIKDFEVTDLNLSTGAPEYSAVHAELMKLIEGQTRLIDQTLNSINNKLKMDYSLYMSLKDKTQTPAVRKTLKEAKARLVKSAKSIQVNEYHKVLYSLIFLDNSLPKIVQKCLTVLCVNMIQQDYKNWYRLAKRTNLSINLDATKINQISGLSKATRKQKNQDQIYATARNKYLPVSIEMSAYEAFVEDQQRQIEIEQLKINQENASRIEAARQEKLKKEQADKRAKLIEEMKLKNVKCREVKIEGEMRICERPYFTLNNEEISYLSASFSDQTHQAICESIGTKKSTYLQWSWDKDKDVGVEVLRVLCYEKKAIEPRLVHDGVIKLDDGNTLIKNPRYRFEAHTRGISDESNTTTLCKIFGYQHEVSLQKWTKEYDSDYENVILKETLTTKRADYQYTYINIYCR